MGPIWGRQDPGGPHVGPMNFIIWGVYVCEKASTKYAWSHSIQIQFKRTLLPHKTLYSTYRHKIWYTTILSSKTSPATDIIWNVLVTISSGWGVWKWHVYMLYVDACKNITEVCAAMRDIKGLPWLVSTPPWFNYIFCFSGCRRKSSISACFGGPDVQHVISVKCF